jgi:hypothetical protein
VQKLNNAVVKENLIEFGEWFILVDLSMSQVKVTHKTDGRNWVFYSIEEALEAVV